MLASFGVHIGVAVAMFVLPREWFARETPIQVPMTLAMGTPGERTGGLNAAGAQPVEEVAPVARRPSPQQTVTPPRTADPVLIPTKTPPKTPPKPVEATPAPPAVPRPPVTGAQVTPGTAVAATSSTSQTSGLSRGGGAGGTQAQVDVDFCCPAYLSEVQRRIEVRWDRNQQEIGETTIVFEIARDGSISKPQVEKKSGSIMLDLAAQSAFTGLVLPPLPDQFTGKTLKIHMIFPYKR